MFVKSNQQEPPPQPSAPRQGATRADKPPMPPSAPSPAVAEQAEGGGAKIIPFPTRDQRAP
jgi:hypothetical protein